MSNKGLDNNSKIGVVLMTYGSATTSENVREYFERIYKGKASEETIKDFENRYALVGHSPLVEITNKQAQLLEKSLGDDFVVRAGMRHSAPTIEEAVSECKASGAGRLIGIILSPQFSSFIMEGYRTTFAEAALRFGFDAQQFTIATQWATQPQFIEFLTGQITASLIKLQGKHSMSIPVIFTTHSLPQRVVEKDPGYLDQLTATIDEVRKQLDEKVGDTVKNLEWYSAYQSAGHTPEEWLKPDLLDIIDDLSKEKKPAVLIVPIQFLTDHLEVLYDLDIAARKQCEEKGIEYNRIELPNTDPLFIEALKRIALSYTA